jgi:hypothetical protein
LEIRAQCEFERIRKTVTIGIRRGIGQSHRHVECRVIGKPPTISDADDETIRPDVGTCWRSGEGAV